MSPRTRESFPRAVREVEHVFIPLSDGTRLAARMWLPDDAEQDPVPAILEYIPYRKRDFMRLRDEPMHAYYAGHGYAAVRVDLRGSGDSDGVLDDEYLPREQLDALEVIDWLTAQAWCDGNVGMTGISWGGFNALQVAAHAPAALKAVITLCASDDRYADDAHYMGGCLLNENQIWGTVLFTINALPPDPALSDGDWRTRWRERLEHDRPFPAVWLRHQRRDDYWKQGSVCEDFTRIRCPVYAIGGWADGYSNAVPRLLRGLEVPRKGLIGPWAHTFPHNGVPGPAIGYLQEAVRWWDHWLKGIDRGMMDEPMLRAWMQDYVSPEPFHEERPGRWVAEDGWPSARIETAQWHLTGTAGLERSPIDGVEVSICSPETTGLAGGDWCGFGSEGEAPLDQRGDDGRSLVFDTEPLDEHLEILGFPEATLRIAVDRPVAMIAVRLNDVAPDGSSARVTYGILNLTHRESHAHPSPLVPDETFSVRLELNACAHRFRVGHVIRLAVSTVYWPMAWPAPSPVTLTVHTGASRLSLPVRPPDPRDDALAPFAPAEVAARSSSRTPLEPQRFVRSVERDLTTNEVAYRLISEGGDLPMGSILRIEEIDLDLGHSVERRFHIVDGDPLSARAVVAERIMLRRSDWKVTVTTRTELTADEQSFRVRAWLDAWEGDEQVFERTWDEVIARDLV